MGFQFQARLSPWSQEALYRAMFATGSKPVFKSFLVNTIVDASQDPELVKRGIEIAKQLVEERTGVKV